MDVSLVGSEIPTIEGVKRKTEETCCVKQVQEWTDIAPEREDIEMGEKKVRA